MTVALQDVTIRYGDVIAVSGATVTFPRGAVGLLGRNGAGKSSILKALLGLVHPVEGELRIFELSPGARGEDVRRRVGYMPEADCYIQGLNGFETVRLAAELTGVPRLDAARRAHEVLYLVGLDEQRYRPVSGYSAGMRQKVKLAAALVHDPEILFLDEPTNGLDPGGRADMLALIGRLTGELGKWVVLSSHILQDVESVCDTVVLMERGHVLAAAPLAELLRTDVRAYELDVEGETSAVVAALQARGVGVAGNSGRLALSVAEDVGVGAVFAAAAEAGAAVLRLVEQRRSLEDVFVSFVEQAGTG